MKTSQISTYEKYISAGRLINDICIDDLANEYKRKVFNTISFLNFKTVVFDFDGTLTEFKYSENKLLPCKDNNLLEYSKEHNLYENVNILNTMKYILNELDINNIYILTVTVDTLKDKKEKCILQNFDIKKENIIQVANPSEKIVFLKNLYNKTNKEIIFVEDTAKTLLMAEENLPYIKGLHISSLIP